MTLKPTAISLFSGMGGDSLGIQEAGFEIIAFNELDEAAVKSHLNNFPHSILIQDPTQKKRTEIIFKLFQMKHFFLIKIRLIWYLLDILVKDSPMEEKNYRMTLATLYSGSLRVYVV